MIRSPGDSKRIYGIVELSIWEMGSNLRDVYRKGEE
jgi:hypothetical protein